MGPAGSRYVTLIQPESPFGSVLAHQKVNRTLNLCCKPVVGRDEKTYPVDRHLQLIPPNSSEDQLANERHLSVQIPSHKPSREYTGFTLVEVTKSLVEFRQGLDQELQQFTLEIFAKRFTCNQLRLRVCLFQLTFKQERQDPEIDQNRIRGKILSPCVSSAQLSSTSQVRVVNSEHHVTFHESITIRCQNANN